MNKNSSEQNLANAILQNTKPSNDRAEEKEPEIKKDVLKPVF